MLTRTQIVSYCTGKLGITDAAATSIAGTFVDARHQMIWNEADWRQARYQEAVAVVAGTQNYTLNAEFEFPKIARWNGAYDVPIVNDITALQRNAPGYDTPGPVLAIVPLARSSTSACQIRLIQVPTQAGTLLVIGKKKVTAIGAGDPPPIPGEDMVLVELVMGDLYEWLRQFSKAEYYFRKGAILLDKMKELETAQAGELRQIIPYTQELDSDPGTVDSLRPLG